MTQPPLPALPECASYAQMQAANLADEIKEAEFVLVQSEYSARAAKALGVSADRIVRCHLGVDTSYFRPRIGERKPGPVRVLFMGGPMYRKGVAHLVEAWNELRPVGAELLMSGNTPRRPTALDNLPTGIPNCKVLGRVPDGKYLELLQDADILVHPSLAEGGCNVVYESLACGLPCIVSTNATSAVRSGKEGIVIPVGDIKALREPSRYYVRTLNCAVKWAKQPASEPNL